MLANARFDAWAPHAEKIRFIIRAHAASMLASARMVTDEVVEIALHAGGAAIVNAEQEIGDHLEVSRYSMRAALESIAPLLAGPPSVPVEKLRELIVDSKNILHYDRWQLYEKKIESLIASAEKAE